MIHFLLYAKIYNSLQDKFVTNLATAEDTFKPRQEMGS